MLRVLGVQVLFSGSSSARVKPARRLVARRGAPRRRVFRVSGASVGVRDARYFKFHPGYRALLPATDSPPSLPPSLFFPHSPPFPLSLSVPPRFPSALLRNVSPTISCCHLIPEVDTRGQERRSLRRIPGSAASYFVGMTVERREISRVCARAFSAIKVPFIFTP